MFSEKPKMNTKTEKRQGIPEAEIELSFSRSGGAGGQNVNKVETKVAAAWNFEKSGILNEKQKALIREKLGNHLDSQGRLVFNAQSERSQGQNREIAIEKLNRAVAEALQKPEERRPTKPTRSSKERRIERKKHTAQKKSERRQNFE